MSTAPRPAKRGRPVTGQALSSTQRNSKRVHRLRGDGGQVLTALLDPAAAQALRALRAGGCTVDAAVCAALVQAAAAVAGAQTCAAWMGIRV